MQMKNTWLFLPFCLFSFSTVGAQNCTTRLTGHVEDADTREKLAGAVVTVVETGKEILTDEKGDFVFDSLCTASYTIRISHVACETVSRQVAVSKNMHVDIDLPHARNLELAGVTVTAQKSTTDIAGYRQVLKGQQLEQTKGLSLAESLSKINGVTLLQTGSTISKPVIHGLHSNRILTINNGVRQEGQQWGNEHAPEIDPFIADNLVVIKGVDELRYGSDAIGGVILVNTKPMRYQPGWYGELNTGYFSNNGQYVVSGMYEQQLKKLPAFSYRLQGTFKKAGNVAAPGYRLNNTALQEANFSATAAWKKERYNIEAFYSQFNTKIGIFTGSHIGNLTDLINAIASTKPNDIYLGENSYSIGRPSQQVAHRLYKLKSNISTGFGSFNLQFAAQHNRRQEFDIIRGNGTKPQMNLAVLTLSEDVSWEHPKLYNFTGTVGIAAQQQDNTYGGRYFIPNYFATTYGGYWLEKWLKHKWELQAGIRYDYKKIDTKRLLYSGSEINHVFDYSTLASSLNALYRITNGLKVNLSATLSQRAPYVNELLSDGIHHGTGLYEKGNINMVPERSVNIAAGLSYSNKANTFSAEISVYNNRINHFIYQQPKPDSPVLTIAGAFPLMQYEQTNATLRGLDVAIHYNITKRVVLSSKASLLRAYNRSIDDWLISMPSDRLSNELTYNFTDKGRFSQSYISVEMPIVFKQTRVPDEAIHGKQDYKQPPPGYSLLNLNASTVLKVGNLPLTIGVGAKNLLNKSYREYLNSFRYFADEMGRNISIRLKLPLENLF